MIDDIMVVFDGNIRRINQLLELYAGLTDGAGRRDTHKVEILRASVVLLHSSLEDYLRNLLRWKLPLTSVNRMNEIPLAGIDDKNRTKFQLGELIRHRDKSVDEIIALSVDEHLSKTSFNNIADITRTLFDIGVALDEQSRKRLFPKLEAMMKRRHHIVHQADRSDKSGSGQHRYKSLSANQVVDWKKTVDKFVLQINSNMLK